MAKIKLRSNYKASHLFFLLGLICSGLPLFTLANSSLSSERTKPTFTLAAKFNPPPNSERPTGVESGAPRGCRLKDRDKKNVDSSPILLVPNQKLAPDEQNISTNQKGKLSQVSLTISGYPTFFIYVPDEINEEVEFSLFEYDLVNKQNVSELYKTRFVVNRNPGIISISLPANTNLPPLQVGKKYRWYFSLICNPLDSTADVTKDEFIERIALDSQLASKLEKATLREKVDLYAEAGIWQDTLTTLAQLRQKNPNDSVLKAEWESLLKSVALEEVAKEPLIIP